MMPRTSWLSVVALSLLSGDAPLQRESLAIPRAVTASTPPANVDQGAPLARLPVRFEPNAGQFDAPVRFLARSRGATLFLTDDAATLSLRSDTVLTLRVAGGRRVTPRADRRLVTISNYFLGNDPSRWRTDIPNFGRVVYPGVLPGVDLVYHGKEGQLEYDFVVAPGADSKEIAMEVSGAKELSLTSTGDLVIHTENGVLLQPRPRVYQLEASGETQEVAAGYRLIGRRSVGFEVAAYDRTRELVIDPVLSYSTYLGGGDDDRAQTVAVDGTGNAYLAGRAGSTNFPTQGPFQAARSGPADAFVAKLNAAGNTLVYSTYLGGSGADRVTSVAVDATGNAHVTGETSSADFPTQGPFQAARSGSTDAFVVKLSANGSALVYSTYLGGSGTELGAAIAVDGTGNAYVAGSTGSANFPTVNPFQTTYAGGGDVFVTKLNPAGSALVYSTFLGSGGPEDALCIAVDGVGSAYVAGSTYSTTFPTQSPFQPAKAGPGTSEDAFVTKLSPTGNALVYSTFLGGNDDDRALGIAVDGTGSAYVTGRTASMNFPAQAPLQAAYGGGPNDAFVTKLNAAGSALLYSTYLGGSGEDSSAGIAVDSAGFAYVAGSTASTDFPTQGASQATSGGDQDVFVTKLNPAGSAFAYSTYLGGGNVDRADGIAVDRNRSAYVAGFTNSRNFPRPGALQSIFGGDPFDGILTKLSSPPIILSPASATVAPGGLQIFVTSGGSGRGNLFVLQTNASGGSIGPTSGIYTAGLTINVTDVVRVTDSEGTVATADVRVAPPPPPPDAGLEDAGDAGDAALPPSDGAIADTGTSDAAPADAAIPADTGTPDPGPGPTGTENTGGCGCRTASARAAHGAGWISLLALGALLVRRRARRR